MNECSKMLHASLVCLLLMLGVPISLLPAAPPEELALSTGSSERSTKANLILPSMFADGFMLESDRPVPRPIAFIDRPGRELTYLNPARPGERLSVFILTVPTASEAADHLRVLTGLDDLPRLEIASFPQQIERLVVQQGRQDNPAATTMTGPTPLTRVVIWWPPHLIYLLAQSDTLATSTILTFLKEIH